MEASMEEYDGEADDRHDAAAQFLAASVSSESGTSQQKPRVFATGGG
jgi:hypothetical protein